MVTGDAWSMMEREREEVGERRETSEEIKKINTQRYGSSGMILPHGPEIGNCIKIQIRTKKESSF